MCADFSHPGLDEDVAAGNRAIDVALGRSEPV